MPKKRRVKSMFDEWELFLFFLMERGGAKTRYLPELYYLFGEEGVNEMIAVFAGKTIKIPTRHFIEELKIRFNVWQLLQNGQDLDDIISVMEKRGYSRAFVTNSIRMVDESFSKLDRNIQKIRDGKPRKRKK